MGEYEKILLNLADNLKNKDKFTFDRHTIITALEVGAYAIRAIKDLQDALGNIGIGGIKNE